MYIKMGSWPKNIIIFREAQEYHLEIEQAKQTKIDKCKTSLTSKMT